MTRRAAGLERLDDHHASAAARAGMRRLLCPCRAIVSLLLLRRTSVLLYMAMREYLRWSLALSAAVAGCFLIVDSAFFLSNAAKIAEGG